MGTVVNSPRACGDFIGTLNGCEVKRKRVKHAINGVVDVAKYSPIFNLFYRHFLFIIVTE